ncbi:MAG: EAL domain-containing protein [Asticcacaulis sp.]
MSVSTDNPDLLKAQYQALSHQIPLMYLTLLVNTWALVSSFLGHAPIFLTLICPLLASIMAVTRMVGWWRSRKKDISAEDAARAMTRTNRLAWLIAIAFTSWSLSLYPYGTPYQQGHLAFYMAISVIGCIFCLLHLKPAAFTVAGVVNLVFVVFFSLSANPIFIAIAVNVALVTGVMLVILTINYRDFTRMIEAKARSEALSNENLHLANLDSLTNLPNRRKFFSVLHTAITEAGENGGSIAAGIIDLDGFKTINDLHGHATGDKLLVALSKRLQTLQSDTVLVARLGGDEFALILKDYGTEADIISFGQKVCELLHLPVFLPEATVRTGGSVGFATFPAMATTAEDLFDRADYALYRSKQSQRGQVQLFSADHEAAICRDARIEQALTLADLDAELSIVFQPIVNIRSHTPIALEALARWDSPLVGNISPDQFVPVAERAGMIGLMTRHLLEKALSHAVSWPDDIRLSFNLSAHDLSCAEGVLRLITIIETSGFDPKRLDLEITETAVMLDFNEALNSINMLKTLGCGISLDDFGTGFASLSQIHALPLNRIKIDRSFVTNIDRTPASFKIVKSLLALCADMELGCVTEGVETQAEAATLQQLGCRYAQGYFYSPPLSAEDIPDYLALTKANYPALSA